MFFPSVNTRQYLRNDVTGLALPQRPRLSLLRLIAFAELKLGHRNRTVLTVTLGLSNLRKSDTQQVQRVFHNIAVLAVKRLAKRPRHRISTSSGMLQSIDQVMRILALETLVERKCLQA